MHNHLLSKISLASLLVMALITVGLSPIVNAHSGDEITSAYGSTPTIDGILSTGEWDDASNVAFSVTNGNCTVYVKQNGTHLHVAFDVPDNSSWAGEGSHVILDADYNGGEHPQTDDIFLVVHRKTPGSLLEEYNGTGTQWRWNPEPFNWTAARSSTVDGYQTEYSIPYSKIGVTAGVDKTLGVAFMTWDNLVTDGWLNYSWPFEANRDIPNTWADLTSSDPYYWVPENPLTIVAIVLMLSFAVIVYPYMRKRRALLNG